MVPRSSYGMEDLERIFTDAFERYSDELFRHCAMRLSNRDRALELTQECFMRTWQYAQKGQEIRELRPFLYRTLRNLVIDEYRRHKPQSLEAMVTEEKPDVEALLPADESNTLTAAIERHEGARALEVLKQLPDPSREALALRYVEGLSLTEIADIIDETENAVSVRIHRGLKKLKELLEPTHTSPDIQK